MTETARRPSTCTMTLNMSEVEMRALDELATEHDMSKTAVMRQALRLYQYVHHRLKEGETMSFSGDARRTAEFIGIGFPMPSPPHPTETEGRV